MKNNVKVHPLTGKITCLLMLRAFKAVKLNRGAAGVDKQSIGMFEQQLEQNLTALMRELKTHAAFKPKPLRRVHIPKGPGAKELQRQPQTQGNVVRE